MRPHSLSLVSKTLTSLTQQLTKSFESYLMMRSRKCTSGGGGGGGTASMRVLKVIERRWLAPLIRNDAVQDKASYKRLAPLPLLKLSVLKLDGSSFEIHVGRTATIAELKQAVQVFFTSYESYQTKIPWSLVWGHFCLCHVGQKLTNDRAWACIRHFGIKDGDQIQFMRHMSISNMPLKKWSKSETVANKQHLMLTYESNGHEEEADNGSEDCDTNAVHEDNSRYHHDPIQDEEEESMPEFKLARFLKGWLSYSKVVEGLKRGIRRQESVVEMSELLRNRL